MDGTLLPRSIWRGLLLFGSVDITSLCVVVQTVVCCGLLFLLLSGSGQKRNAASDVAVIARDALEGGSYGSWRRARHDLYY